MVKHLLITLTLLLLLFTPLAAEVDLDATLYGTVSASKTGDDDVTSSGVASGSLTVKSTGSNYVKSQLTLDFTSVRNVDVMSISKAWVKFRYPVFRATLGKNRITWGEGAAFNAGDVIFDDYSDGDSEEELDLTAAELKSLNRTMALITFPLGRYTFTEAIYLPYDFFSDSEIATIASGEYPDDLDISEHSAGGRFVSRLGGVKLEAGYLFNGYTEMHKPYISVNGTLGVDYQASASVNIEHGDTGFDSWKDTFKISPGIFYFFDLEDDKTLSLRLESLIYPFGDWDVDALQLYPEIALVPNDELSLFLRSVINPFDLNIESSAGLNWKTYQGFSIGSYYTVEIVEDVDTTHTVSVVVTHKF